MWRKMGEKGKNRPGGSEGAAGAVVRFVGYSTIQVTFKLRV